MTLGFRKYLRKFAYASQKVAVALDRNKLSVGAHWPLPGFSVYSKSGVEEISGFLRNLIKIRVPGPKSAHFYALRRGGAGAPAAAEGLMLWLGGAAPPKAQDAHAPGATSASRQCSPAASHSPQPPGTDRSFASLVPRLTSSQIDELIRNALQRQRHQEANGVGRHQAGQMATVCRNLEEASPRGTGAKFVAVPKSTLEAKKTTKKRPRQQSWKRNIS